MPAGWFLSTSRPAATTRRCSGDSINTAEAGVELRWPTCCRRSRSPASRPARLPSRRQTARPGCTAAPGILAHPRRRWNRHGRHQLGRTTHRERQRRHEHLRDDRARARTQPSTRELDLVTTPAGRVAMVHCNNGASELNAWVGLFAEFAEALGADVDTAGIFETLVIAARDGAPDCGGLMAYNYLSGEPITELDEGRPLFLRSLTAAISPPSCAPICSHPRPRGSAWTYYRRLRRGLADVRTRRPVQDQGRCAELPRCRHQHPVSVGEVAAEGGAWESQSSRRTSSIKPAGRPWTTSTPYSPTPTC